MLLRGIGGEHDNYVFEDSDDVYASLNVGFNVVISLTDADDAA